MLVVFKESLFLLVAELRRSGGKSEENPFEDSSLNQDWQRLKKGFTTKNVEILESLCDILSSIRGEAIYFTLPSLPVPPWDDPGELPLD